MGGWKRGWNGGRRLTTHPAPSLARSLLPSLPSSPLPPLSRQLARSPVPSLFRPSLPFSQAIPALLLPFTALNLPAGTFVYWVSSAAFTLVQTAAFDKLDFHRRIKATAHDPAHTAHREPHFSYAAITLGAAMQARLRPLRQGASLGVAQSAAGTHPLGRASCH